MDMICIVELWSLPNAQVMSHRNSTSWRNGRLGRHSVRDCERIDRPGWLAYQHMVFECSDRR